MMELSDEVEEDYSGRNRLSPSPRVIYTDLDMFLDAIHAKFLECVQPVESTLLDLLRQEGGLTRDEEEEIRAEVTTRDKARALWNTLHRLPPKFFETKCMPILEQLYPHVLYDKDFRWARQSDPASSCVRHAMIKRMRMTRFVDVFPTARACTHEEYKELTSGKDKWKQVFCLLKKHSKNDKLKLAVKEALNDIGVQPSRHFNKLFRNGFPCTCHKALKQVCPDQPITETTTAQDMSSSTTDYSATDEQMESSDMEISDSCSDMEQGREPDLSCASFSSRSEKLHFKNTLNQINRALTDVSLVEPLSRQLECIKEDVSILAKKAQDEPAWETDDRDQLRSLKGKADKVWKQVKCLYQKAKNTMAQILENSDSRFSAAQHNVKVRGRRALLEKKARKAERFFKQSSRLVKHISEVTSIRNKD